MPANPNKPVNEGLIPKAANEGLFLFLCYVSMVTKFVLFVSINKENQIFCEIF